MRFRAVLSSRSIPRGGLFLASEPVFDIPPVPAAVRIIRIAAVAQILVGKTFDEQSESFGKIPGERYILHRGKGGPLFAGKISGRGKGSMSGKQFVKSNPERVVV